MMGMCFEDESSTVECVLEGQGSNFSRPGSFSSRQTIAFRANERLPNSLVEHDFLLLTSADKVLLFFEE